MQIARSKQERVDKFKKMQFLDTDKLGNSSAQMDIENGVQSPTVKDPSIKHQNHVHIPLSEVTYHSGMKCSGCDMEIMLKHPKEDNYYAICPDCDSHFCE
jgi:hypothetical protein